MKPFRVGIVAGESSADNLGASLLCSLRNEMPTIEVVGIGGPKMIAEGMESLFPMESLSVMGIVEVLSSITSLLKIRSKLFNYFCQNKLDLFIGIDAPDFNLPLEKKLHDHGIVTIHYVSPSVWAWREQRLNHISKSVDHVLCLLPFELEIYEKYKIPATYVGHPLADEIPLVIDVCKAREDLKCRDDELVIVVLPGSRKSEVARLLPDFLKAVQIVAKQDSRVVKCFIPCVNAFRYQQIQKICGNYRDLNIELLEKRTYTSMSAADVILTASGTAALEAALHKKPMVVAYRVAFVTYLILKCMIKTEWISLPNILASKALVPEILQGNVTPEALAKSLLEEMDGFTDGGDKHCTLMRLHKLLQCNGSEKAAKVVKSLLNTK